MPNKEQSQAKAKKSKKSKSTKPQGGKGNATSGGISRPLRMGLRQTHRTSEDKEGNVMVPGEIPLGSVTLRQAGATGGPIVAGDIVRNEILIRPGALTGTRMALFAQAFEKYRFKEAELIYRPSCASTTGGQLVAYFEVDPNEVVNSATSTIVDIQSRAVSHQGAQIFNSFTPAVIKMPKRLGLKDFFCSNNGSSSGTTENYLTTQAKVVVVQMAAPVNPAPAGATGVDVAVGTLFLKFKAHFMGPQLQPNIGNSSQGIADEVDLIGSAQLTTCFVGGGISSLVTLTASGAPGGGTLFGQQIVSFSSTGGDGVWLSNVGTTEGEKETVSNLINFTKSFVLNDRMMVRKNNRCMFLYMPSDVAGNAGLQPFYEYRTLGSFASHQWRVANAFGAASAILGAFLPLTTELEQMKEELSFLRRMLFRLPPLSAAASVDESQSDCQDDLESDLGDLVIG